MTYNISQKIDLEKIVVAIFQSEAKILEDLILKLEDPNLDDIYQQVNVLTKVKFGEEIISGLTAIFKTLSDLKVIDLAIVFQQFVQRYLYFVGTIKDFNNYCETNNSAFKDLEDQQLFSNVVALFFNGQIDYYTQRYLNLVNTSELTAWSPELSAILNQFCNNIIQNDDIIQKLHYLEGLSNYLSDFNNFLAKIDIEQNSEAKEQFLNNTLEMKVVTQSITTLIEKVVEQINITKGE
ncbi:hypothetical protein [Mesoplasma seiffertii]|uniref:hypothetical protein n=1 Tax=Mesoplasma seiffertii TaxID=28224 RepID=UPI00047C707B|nr:hypothetical protein [Mesoplasma seiffertii]